MIGSSKSLYGFDPRTIPGCQLWLDGADPAGTGVRPANGSTLTTWKDKSVSNFPFTSVGSSYNTTAVNGLPGINISTNPFGYNPGSAQNNWQEVFAIGLWTGGSTFNTYNGFITSFGENDGGAGGGIIFIGDGTTNWYNINAYQTPFLNGIQTNTALPTIQRPFCIRIHSTSAVNVTGLQLGVDRANGRNWVGFISEVIIYNTALTTSQRQQVEGYLAHKWGLVPYYDFSTPLSIPGCALWLDGADSSSLVLSGSNVTQWNDKSGNGFNGTVVNASVGNPIPPSYVTNSINGLSAITMSGTSYFQGTTNVNGTVCTSFFVGSCTFGTGGSSQQRLLAIGELGLDDYSVAARCILLQVYSSGTKACPFRAGVFPTVTIENSSINLYSVIFDGTNASIYLNGNTPVSLASSGSFITNIYAVGSDAGTQFMGGTSSLGTNCLVGKIGEILVYNTALTTSQRQQVEGYLSRKWGIGSSSIPSTHPFSSVRPHLRPFQPTDIDGCQLWLDGADASTVTLTASKVTQWNDKSGNGYNFTQSTSGNQPTYSTSSLNSLNTITFTASNSTYLLGTASTNFIGTNSLSMYGVFKTNDANSGSSVFAKSLYGGAAGRILYGYRDPGTPGFIVFANSGGIAHDIPDTYTPGAWRIAGFVSDRSGWTNITYQNGTITATKTSGADTTTNLTNAFPMLVGAYNNSSGGANPPQADRYLDGAVGELIIFNNALTTSQRQQVEGYLAHKWGLTLYLPVISPLSIPGCQLWLDGTDPAGNGVIPSNGDTVSTWVDKSGNGYNATAAPSRTAGTYSSSFRAVYFPTSTTGYITNYTAAPTNETMFVVFNNPTSSFYNNILIGGVQGARSLGAGYSGNGGQTVGVVGNLNTQIAWLARTNGGSYALGTTALVTSQFTTSTNSISINGGTAASGGAPGFTSGRVTYLGVDATNATFYYVGYAMEILFYNSILTSSQIQQIEGYLARKWGITISATLPSLHPFKSIPPASLPFSPRNITGCLLWLDGADTGSMTLSGSSVTQWNDKSGRGFNVATSSGATAPLYNSSTKELQFVSGNSNSFTIPQAFGDALVGTTFSFFFIGRRTVNTTYAYFLSGATSGGNQNLFIGFLSNKMEIGEYGPYASADIPTFSSPDPMRLYYYDIQSSTTANLIMNGNALSTTVSGNLFLTSFAQPELGRRYGGAVYHDFNLSEMVVFSPALNTSQRQQVEGYLAHKWGLASSLFTPLSITGCQLWLDAADSSTITFGTGSSVASWRDKANNYAVANSSASYRPVYSQGTIRFDGVTSISYLDIPTLTIGSSTFSIFFVARNTSTTTDPGNASSPQIFWPLSGNGSGALSINGWISTNIQGVNNNINSTLLKNQYYLFSYTFGVTTNVEQLYVNGTSVGTYSKGSAYTSSLYRIGAINTSSQQFSFDGNIGEILVYNTALTTSERQRIEGYLSQKWGLGVSSTNPSTHPFYKFPPA
jgi:hypothetical protein